MPQALVVIEPFGSYAVGDRISDGDAMKVAAEQHHTHVVRVNLPDAALPEHGGEG